MATPETAAAPAPQRFDSLDAMRAAYAALLKDLPTENLSAEQGERVRGFLKNGVATGALLDSPADRKAAQAMLDYWRATLYTESRGQGNEQTAAPAQRLAESVLAPFDVDTVGGVAKRAEAAVKTMPPEEQELARRLLLRVARLAADQRVFKPEPATLAELEKLGTTPGQIDPLLKRLVGLGVIREEGGHYGLAYEALARHWDRLHNWLDQRLRFRDAAQYWDKHQRNESALIGDALLEEAHGYHDRNALEEDFVHASRKRQWHQSRVYQRWALVFAGLALLALGCAVAAFLYARTAKAEAEKAAKAERAERKANEELKRRQRLDRLKGTMLLLSRTAARGAIAESNEAAWQIVKGQGELLKKGLERDADFNAMLAGNDKLKAIVYRLAEALNRTTWDQALPDLSLKLGRELRKQVFPDNDPETPTLLQERRRAIYHTYYLYSKWIVENLKKQRPISVTAPVVDELRAYFFGEMVVVEDPKVESAEVAFMGKLREIENSITSKLKPAQQEAAAQEIQSCLSGSKQYQRKGKVTYTAQLFSKAMAPAVMKKLRPDTQKLAEVVNATTADPKQVEELEELLNRLKKAMDAELNERVSCLEGGGAGQRPLFDRAEHSRAALGPRGTAGSYSRTLGRNTTALSPVCLI